MWYNGIIKSFLVCIILFEIAVSGTISVYAVEPVYDVSIQLLEEPRVDDSEIVAIVLVEFIDKNLYNDEVYLSYHILNATGEAVVNENERIKINLDDHGNQKFELTINYAEAKIISKDDKLVVTFDIVDEKNVCWFSDTDTINFCSTSINTYRTVGQKVWGEIGNSKVIFGINITIFAVCIVAGVYLYRKREV